MNRLMNEIHAWQSEHPSACLQCPEDGSVSDQPLNGE